MVKKSEEMIEQEHKNCFCGEECKCKKIKKPTWMIISLLVIVLVFCVGLGVGTFILEGGPSDKCVEKLDEKDNKAEDVFKYQATSNTTNISGVVSNNGNKVGSYVIDYHIVGEDEKKKSFSIDFEWENRTTAIGVSYFGIKDDKINLIFEEKTVKVDGYENTVIVVNDYYGYVFVIDYSSFMPLGKVSIYDLSGKLVKTFDNVVNSYYVCGEPYKQENYVTLNVDYSESSYRGTTIYLVENFIEEDYEWNWFDAPVSVYKFNFETLETEKVSEFTACFSQQ